MGLCLLAYSQQFHSNVALYAWAWQKLLPLRNSNMKAQRKMATVPVECELLRRTNVDIV